jgi:hypothetical protein
VQTLFGKSPSSNDNGCALYLDDDGDCFGDIRLGMTGDDSHDLGGLFVVDVAVVDCCNNFCISCCCCIASDDDEDAIFVD